MQHAGSGSTSTPGLWEWHKNAVFFPLYRLYVLKQKTCCSAWTSHCQTRCSQVEGANLRDSNLCQCESLV